MRPSMNLAPSPKVDVGSCPTFWNSATPAASSTNCSGRLRTTRRQASGAYTSSPSAAIEVGMVGASMATAVFCKRLTGRRKIAIRSATNSATFREKVGPKGYDPWSKVPERCRLDAGVQRSFGPWTGIERVGKSPKQAGHQAPDFFLLPSFASQKEVDRILEYIAEHPFNTDPDSVDDMPTYEFYPCVNGKWWDSHMQELLSNFIDTRLLPYVRERYTCPGITLADILVRRYKPDERRTHTDHFDNFAFVTAVLGISDPSQYEGGLFLQPGVGIESRIFPHMDPGDLVVHSYDLVHGVRVLSGSRYSVIFWFKDTPEAVEQGTVPWYEEKTSQGDVHAIFRIGQCWEDDENLNQALEYYERSGQAGYVFAQDAAGVLYWEMGRNSPDDEWHTCLEMSLYWLRKAAGSGLAQSQRNLAAVLASAWPSDRRVDWDKPPSENEDATAKQQAAEACMWLRRAAEQLDLNAAFDLATTLRSGYGTRRDPEEALWWLERSAASGHFLSQVTLGQILAEGSEVPRDEIAAELWLQRAVANGSAVASRQLAWLYRDRGEHEKALQIVSKVGFDVPLDDEYILEPLPYQEGFVEWEEWEDRWKYETTNPEQIASIEDPRERKRAVQSAMRALQPHNVERVRLQLAMELATCHWQVGLIDKAGAVLQQVFDAVEDMGGYALAMAQHNYAVIVLVELGELEDAEFMVISALAELEKAFFDLGDPVVVEVNKSLKAIRAKK